MFRPSTFPSGVRNLQGSLPSTCAAVLARTSRALLRDQQEDPLTPWRNQVGVKKDEQEGSV